MITIIKIENRYWLIADTGFFIGKLVDWQAEGDGKKTSGAWMENSAPVNIQAGH